MSREVLLSASVETDDMLEALTDEELRSEMDRRSLDVCARDAAIEAINAIRRGDTTEAATILEREFLPKWQDKAQCEMAYDRAMVGG